MLDPKTHERRRSERLRGCLPSCDAADPETGRSWLFAAVAGAAERSSRTKADRGSFAAMRAAPIPGDGARGKHEMAKAHLAIATVGEVGLVAVVMRYSRALWAEWIDFNASTAVFGRVLIHAASCFGGAPRRWIFEEPDCRVLHWDGRREHIADLLQAVARHMGSSLGIWHDRYRGPATAACEHLVCAEACPTRLELPAGNAALRLLLDDTVPHMPHPRQPARTIAEMFAEERGHLLPLPDSWGAPDIWFEDENDDGTFCA